MIKYLEWNKIVILNPADKSLVLIKHILYYVHNINPQNAGKQQMYKSNIQINQTWCMSDRRSKYKNKTNVLKKSKHVYLSL